MRRPDYCYIDGQLVERPGRNHPNPEVWSQLRQTIFVQQGGRCKTCPNLVEELHHRHYDNFGNESPFDVVGLCIPCHDAITNRMRSYRFQNGQLDVEKIAGKITSIQSAAYRPSSRVTAIPVVTVNKEPERFRPKQRVKFTGV